MRARAIFREVILWIIVFSPVVGALLFYNQLPETMATHFGVHNEVNGTMSKPAAVSMIAIIGFVPVLLSAVRKFDPRVVNEPKFTIAFQAVRYGVGLVLAAVDWSIVTYNLGYSMDMRKLVFVLIAALFLVIGNYLPVMKPNFTMGIRTPWTLTSDENWRKTHRLGGPVMMIGGLIILVAAFLLPGLSIGIYIGVIALIALLPVGYSFLLFIRKRG
ncbi:SdpI family protein [Paenibacillus thalictri]|uniref:DUF1648 domain-containing protein n=1 Tax=Paenibacillus thalictri TaxID=2527873 RepID=A0A4Q9DJV0_9BACL|nr:SdpI family protein [Paenibacillus thalictri]TBL70891.1 DUF1648 domain-containing protein [Paenibacillus thalictri]